MCVCCVLFAVCVCCVCLLCVFAVRVCCVCLLCVFVFIMCLIIYALLQKMPYTNEIDNHSDDQYVYLF